MFCQRHDQLADDNNVQKTILTPNLCGDTSQENNGCWNLSTCHNNSKEFDNWRSKRS